MQKESNPSLITEKKQGVEQKTGKWDSQERQAFLSALKVHGNDWEMISKYVQTRSPSQVRSHAQKHNNKINNDREKIGFQPIPVRQENEIAITRSKSQIRSNSPKEEDFEVNIEKSKLIKKDSAKEIRDVKKRSEKRKSRRNEFREAHMQSLYVPTAIRNQMSSESFSQMFQTGLFVQQSFPQLTRSLNSSFSVFALRMQGQHEPIEEMVAASFNSSMMKE